MGLSQRCGERGERERKDRVDIYPEEGGVASAGTGAMWSAEEI